MARRTRDDRNQCVFSPIYDSVTDKFSLLRTRAILEEGLHRLYEATVDHKCFPGDPPAEDGEVTTEGILEGLQLSVPSRTETANPPLPNTSGSRRHSFSPSTHDSCGRPFQQSSPQSITSDQSGWNSQTSSHLKTLHIKTRQSSVSASEIQPCLSSPSIGSGQNTVSPASCQSQGMGPFKDVSSGPPPVAEGDMCAQFLLATGYPQPTATQYPSLANIRSPQYNVGEDIFDFDRYNQDAATSMLVSHQQTQDYPLSSMPEPSGGQQVKPGLDVTHSDQMSWYPAYPPNQLPANTATDKFALVAQQ